jgi:hypothetical protein
MHAATEILNRKNAEASPFLIAEAEYISTGIIFLNVALKCVGCHVK